MQHDLPSKVVAHLDFFLVLVGGVIDLVVTLGFEKEMPALAAHHRDQPADQRGRGGVGEQQYVGGQEGERAHQVQRLVDAAVVIVAMVVPTLGVQRLQEAVHVESFTRMRSRWIPVNEISHLDNSKMTAGARERRQRRS